MMGLFFRIFIIKLIKLGFITFKLNSIIIVLVARKR